MKTTTLNRAFGLACLVIGLVVGVGSAAFLEGCSPAQRREGITVTDSIIRAGCIVVRAVTDDSTVREVCATAEDLAPLFAELLAEHDRNVATEPTETAAARLQVAAVLPAPKRHPPLRRCAQWVPVVRSDGGQSDGAATRGTGASPPDGGGPQGSDGGR